MYNPTKSFYDTILNEARNSSSPESHFESLESLLTSMNVKSKKKNMIIDGALYHLKEIKKSYRKLLRENYQLQEDLRIMKENANT